jgi:hypothetical protein
LCLSADANEVLLKEWRDETGTHTLTIKKKMLADNNHEVIGEQLLIKQTTGTTTDWFLKDDVKFCDDDISLGIIDTSVEIQNFPFGNGYIVLFAYKTGCVGGIEPVSIKYIAFNNNTQYSLDGEEHIILGQDGFGGEQPPVPDSNLKNNKPLYDYMLTKWGDVSLTKY